MKILCLDSSIAPAFSAAGHEVLAISTTAGTIDVAQLIEENAFQPDIVLQTENLHHRSFATGLEQVNALKVFWAQDTHLNIHWHKYYTRLFDVVFTPHLGIYGLMPELWTPKHCIRLAREGFASPFRAHGLREKFMSFVGKDDPQFRPLRHRFLELLRPLGLYATQGISPSEMMALYLNSRVVPNESIAFEVNYRLMEGTSTGSCVLAPNIGEDQNCLFTPGQEIMVYEHGLDLLEKVEYLRNNPHEAEKIGMAAWNRVQHEHLPQHRVATILASLEGISPKRVNPTDLVLAMSQRGRQVRQTPPASLMKTLEAPSYPEAFAQHLRLLSEFFTNAEVHDIFQACLHTPELLCQEDIAFVCMAHALRHTDMPLFAEVWNLWHQQNRQQAGNSPPPATSPYKACLDLAELLQKSGRLFQPGFRYDPALMLPETAFEALHMAQNYAEGDNEWAQRIAALTSRTPTMTEINQNILNRLTVGTSNWHARLDYGYTSLRAYDNLLGIAELQLARVEAESQNCLFVFDKLLRERGISPDMLEDILL